MEKIIRDNITFYKIKEFEDFYISKCGKIYSLKKFKKVGRELGLRKTWKDYAGYETIALDKKTRFVHKLLAQTFILNPHNKPFINHINGVKDDNRLENLEWVTAKENTYHCYNILKKKRFSKKVNQYDLEGNFIIQWESCVQAAKKTGVNKRSIAHCARGERKTGGGFKWSYA